MKPEDAYLKFVRWSEDDRFYVGYCPDLFPWGGVCHGETEENVFAELCTLVREEIQELLAGNHGLPSAQTRPMREAVAA
jgi:hypothetical protein